MYTYSTLFTQALSDPGIQLLNKITRQTPIIKAYNDSYSASVDVMLNFTYRHYILYESIYEWILIKSTLYMNYYIECCMIFDMLVEK